MQAFLDDDDECVRAYGNPDLRLAGIPAGTQKCLDAPAQAQKQPLTLQ